MPLDGAYFVKDLDPSNPVGTIDKVSLLDDIIREVKGAIVNTFPDMDGEVKYSTDELNEMKDNFVKGDGEWDMKGNTVVNVKEYDDDAAVQPRLTNDGRYLMVENNLSDIKDKSEAFDNLFKEVDYTSDGVKAFRAVMTNLMYPVGSLYLNVQTDQNPSEYLGVGTWVRFAEGRALVGVGELNDGHETKKFEAGNVFGSFTAELKDEHLPPHTHPHGLLLSGASSAEGGRRAISVDTGIGHGHDYAGSENVGMSNGANKRHDNIQPSIAVHIWRRTA